MQYFLKLYFFSFKFCFTLNFVTQEQQNRSLGKTCHWSESF